jgi:hypothetical protein
MTQPLPPPIKVIRPIDTIPSPKQPSKKERRQQRLEQMTKEKTRKLKNLEKSIERGAKKMDKVRAARQDLNCACIEPAPIPDRDKKRNYLSQDGWKQK